MQVKNTLIKLLVAALLLLPAAVAAQTSSINAFSPYTMYGIGEQNTQGTLQMRSMGGVGVAMRDRGVMNMLNPASHSVAPRRTFLFSFGLEGQNYYNTQTAEGISKRSAYNSFNFHDIALQLPLAKKLGLGFSLTPYSSVGYRTKFYNELDDPIMGAVGPMQYTYEGEGDITEVKLGIGWEPFKNFSIGAAVQYYWGDIDRTFVMVPTSIVGNGNYVSIIGSETSGISRVKGQVGIQYSPILNTKRAFTIGVSYDFGGDLKPDFTSSIYTSDSNYTSIKDETAQLKLVLPQQLAAGVFYSDAKWGVGVDFVHQNWGGRNNGVVNTGVTGTDGAASSYEVAYTNTNTIKAGIEFTPDRYSVRHFMRRIAYRAGFRYGDHNQTFSGHRLAQYAVTAGIGIPVRFFGVSTIDVGIEYGRRGYNVAKSVGLVRQQYFKVALGFSLFAGGNENNDYWFTRPKYD